MPFPISPPSPPFPSRESELHFFLQPEGKSLGKPQRVRHRKCIQRKRVLSRTCWQDLDQGRGGATTLARPAAATRVHVLTPSSPRKETPPIFNEDSTKQTFSTACRFLDRLCIMLRSCLLANPRLVLPDDPHIPSPSFLPSSSSLGSCQRNNKPFPPPSLFFLQPLSWLRPGREKGVK